MENLHKIKSFGEFNEAIHYENNRIDINQLTHHFQYNWNNQYSYIEK